MVVVAGVVVVVVLVDVVEDDRGCVVEVVDGPVDVTVESGSDVTGTVEDDVAGAEVTVLLGVVDEELAAEPVGAGPSSLEGAVVAKGSAPTSAELNGAAGASLTWSSTNPTAAQATQPVASVATSHTPTYPSRRLMGPWCHGFDQQLLKRFSRFC